MTNQLAIGLGFTALVALAACNKPPAPGGNPGGGPGTGDVSSIDACTLLSVAEIQQAFGVPMKPGVLQRTDALSECQWDSQNDGDAASVSVSVATYDDKLFTTMASSKAAVPVSGFGEKAFKGVPHFGDISIRQGGHEIDIGVVDFKMSNEQVDGVAAGFAKRVLARL